MSIVRVGLSETKNFAEGYEAIFGKAKKQDETKAETTEKPVKSAKPKAARKSAGKKK